MKLHLLENRHISGYTALGSYWRKGETKSESYSLINGNGENVPVQTEIAARWPDGSVKWARHMADSRLIGSEAEITPGEGIAPDGQIVIDENDDGWRIDAAQVVLTVCRPGSSTLAKDICLNGQLRVNRITPEFLLERREAAEDEMIVRIRKGRVRIEHTAFEAKGPLECVIRFDGYLEAREQLMPFVIRMYVDYNAPDIRFDHTFLYNGVEERDFLKGLGLRFSVPLTGAAYNHHVKFITDHGIFHEPAVLMESRIPRTGPTMKKMQLTGQTLSFAPASPEAELASAVEKELPVWNKYVLTQQAANAYLLQKRTKPGRCMLPIETGRRAPGAMAVSGETGGILLSLRDFWQRFPSGLEVENLGEPNADCTLWFYSPEANAYDFRHYDDRSYPKTSYEGFENYGASADGIATTSQCRLSLVNEYPQDASLIAFCSAVQKPAVYVASPEEYHQKRAFGYWSLPCTGTEAERSLEDTLEKAFLWYQGQVDQRGWYGLFDYGDIMHSYDADRHCWKYDIGGYAWQNTELVPTYWLWLYFLRTGREDVFSMAEAMSRHTSETDIYHFGPMKGIGSRHNVRHWGCSCKEPRVSMAGHHRPLFYLTGDRRLGDVLDEVKDAADSLGNLYYYRSGEEHILHARTGPDWSSFVSDWMTAYERTLDTAYAEKIEQGINGISLAPLRLGSGPAFAFDAETGNMTYCGEAYHDIHLSLCMGAPQVWMETTDMLENELLKSMLADYGRLYLMTDEERKTAFGSLTEGKPFIMEYVASALAAYSAARNKDAGLAKRAWETLLLASPRRYKSESFIGDVYAVTTDGRKLDELNWVSTNYVSQWCLNVIVALEFIRDSLPSLQEARRLAAIPKEIGK